MASKIKKSKNKEEDEENVWHPQQESILKRWSEIGSSYRYLHDRAFTKYSTQNFRFALPVIVISTITGTANFAQGSFPKSWQSYVPLGIGFLNLSAGLITTIAQFLRVSELLEGHRAAAIAYSKFSRNISVELSLPVEDRSCGGTEFVNKCRNELDRMIEQSPNIPLDIVKKFAVTFKDDDFMKPEILKISSVQVYRDNEKEKLKKQYQSFKFAEKTKQMLLENERVRRASIIEELETQKQNLMEKNNEKKKQLKQKKKENVKFGTISGQMDKLLKKLQTATKNDDIVTPDSSDLEYSPHPSNELTELNDIPNVNIVVEEQNTGSESGSESGSDETSSETSVNEDAPPADVDGGDNNNDDDDGNNE